MTATINASTSSGVVITPDNSGAIALQNAGTTGLNITASGQVTTPLQVGFSVRGMSSTIFNANTGAASYMNGGTTQFNTGNVYNTSTGRFTAPVTGVYFVSAGVLVSSGTGRLEGNLAVNGSSTNFLFNGTGSTFDGPTVTTALSLNAGDYVTVQRASGTAYSDHGNNYFSAFLLG